jgi:predicted acetyltransferase
MALNLRWIGTDELDLLALTRLRCYAKSAGDYDAFKIRAANDPRTGTGDYLLAEVDGQAVGTATHVPLSMHVRGGVIPTQGVAWVGAIRTARRQPGAGVATTVMRAMLRHARDRGNVASALMPFRASYYQHFGYGVVERRHEWTVPLSVLPRGETGGLRFYEPGDFDARSELARDTAAAGQCDFDWSDDYWRTVDQSPEGFEIIDRGTGPADSYFRLTHQQTDGKDIARIAALFYRDAAALKRVLSFCSTLKDQYAAVHLTLPADVPLNRMLAEVQLPHRAVNHAVAAVHPHTRMQVRVLDHQRFLQAIRWPVEAAGAATVAVDECEGGVSRFAVDVQGGRATVNVVQGGEDFRCTDATWAAVACGDLTATAAVRFGQATGTAKGCSLLNAMAAGPVPFSNMFF